MSARKRTSTTNRQEIQFRKSLFRFSLSFVVVLSLGLVTRYFINRLPLKQRIVSAIAVPEDYNLQIHKPEVIFHWGWIPALGLSVQRMELQSKNCSSDRLSAQNVSAVVDPIQLFVGQVVPRFVDVDFLEINRSIQCEELGSGPNLSQETAKQAPDNKEKAPSASASKPLNVEFLRNFFDQYLNQFQALSLTSLSVNRFQIHLLEKLDQEISFAGSGYLRFSDDLRGQLNIQDLFYKKKKLDFIDSEIEIVANSSEISLEALSSIREGEIQLKSVIKNQKTFPVEAQFEFQKVPVSPIVGFFQEKLALNYLWLSCKGKVNSAFNVIRWSPIETSDCQLEGPYGNLVVKNFQGNSQEIKSMKMEVSKLQIDKVLKNRREAYLSGVFQNFGILSAQVDIKNSLLDIQGVVENSEFIFSNNNLRDIQKLHRLPFKFSGNQKAWVTTIEKVDVDEGEFSGELQIKQNREQKAAEGRIAIHKLKLSPRIYKLILNSEPTELKIYGKFQWQENKLDNWSALLATPELKSPQYNFKNLKVWGEKKDTQSTDLKVQILQGDLSEQAPLVKWLQPTHLDKKWQPGPIAFRELSTKLTVLDDRRVMWKRGYVRLKNGWQLSSEGERAKDRSLKAWLQWDRPDGRYMKWDLQGPLFAGSWSPLTPWVKSWLNNNSEFLSANQNIVYDSKPAATIKEKINEVRSKAIEKVKSVLKPKEEKK